jgi:hypothetical protein
MHFPHQWSANVIAAPTKVGFDLAPVKLKGSGRWISLLTSIVSELWLRMAREREIRRMQAAWATIDDRILRDIGVSRWEMAYAGVPENCMREVGRRRAADMKVTQPCNGAMGRVSAASRAEIASRIPE